MTSPPPPTAMPPSPPNPDPAPFDREAAAARLRSLANVGIHIGTSSWKYPGWLGSLYSPDRYTFHGRFAQTRFNRICLSEYAEVFPTVCVDAAYYRFPEPEALAELSAQTPEGFRFGFKVTDDITLKRFPRLPRFGDRAGQANPTFLNAEVFTTSFLSPLSAVRPKVGIVIFEFSRFRLADFARGRDFVAALDVFLSRLPAGWPYGIEVRNPNLLHPAYFEVLARHRVAHVFNSWQSMPAVQDQLAMPEAFTCPSLAACRLLLRPGRSYEQAVALFQPYNRLQDPFPDARLALANFIHRVATRDPQAPRRLYIFINNRFEGSALHSIAALLASLDAS